MRTKIGLAVTSALMSALPNRMPGKTRITRALLAQLSNGGEAMIWRNGLSYRVPSLIEPITVGIVALGTYEPDTIEFVLQELSQDGVFVDVGANIGAITLPVAKARPRVRILAIEASKQVFSTLSANIRDNGLANVTPVCAFAGEIDRGEVAFYEAPNRKFGMGSAGPQFQDGLTSVQQRTLDALLAEHGLPTPDVIKIDIEGAEVMALKGMERTLTVGPKRPVLLFEFNDWAEVRIPGQQAGDAQRFLIERGYALRDAGRDGTAITRPMASGGAMIIARTAGFAPSSSNR